MVIQADVFWKAAVITAVILIIGIQIGVWMEGSRIDEIRDLLTETEIQFNDARMQTLYIDKLSFSDGNFCENAVKANLKFNQDIYQEGLKIEKAETVNRFTPYIFNEKRRYALLQLQFWMNALNIKEECSTNYTTVLYVYTYDTKNDRQLEIDQKLQSAILLDLKEKCGNEVMLSPIPKDVNLTTVDMLVNNFGITKTPAVILNKNVTLQGLQKLEDLEVYVEC